VDLKERSAIPHGQKAARVVYRRKKLAGAWPTLAMCTCHRCGQNSLYKWLYHSIYGEEFQSNGHPPYVNEISKWPEPPFASIGFNYDQTDAHTEVIAVVRDPLDRYLDVYMSNIRCERGKWGRYGPWGSDAHAIGSDGMEHHGHDPSLDHDSEIRGHAAFAVREGIDEFTEGGNYVVQTLLTLAGLNDGKLGRVHDPSQPTLEYCLGFSDFMRAMRAVHAQGKQDQLVEYLRPQNTMGCADGKKLTISQLAKEIGTNRSYNPFAERYGLHAVPMGWESGYAQRAADLVPPAAMVKQLCALVKPEYDWMNDLDSYRRECPDMAEEVAKTASMTRAKTAGKQVSATSAAAIEGSKKPLTIFIHVGKCGSTTVRDLMHRLQDETAQALRWPEAAPWLCELSVNGPEHHLDKTSCPHAEVALNGDQGACDALGRPCRYLVILREPIERLISEYQYFCKECREGAKFCGAEANTGCPKLSFLDWAKSHANQFTHHFSRAHVTGAAYYDEYVHGFVGRPALTGSDIDAAAKFLSGGDVKLIKTEELDASWADLAEWMDGTQMAVQLKQLLQTTDPSSLHENSGTDAGSRYVPTPLERRQACEINWHDCQLVAQLGSHQCMCEKTMANYREAELRSLNGGASN